MGIAARGNYDLTAHATASGTNLEYFDEASVEKRRYIPHVIEPSCGVDRLFLANTIQENTWLPGIPSPPS